MYLLSILLFLILCIAYAIITGQNSLESIMVFVDMPSMLLLFMIVIPVFISSGLWKDFNNAFRLSIKERESAGKVELMRAVEAVSFMIKTLWVTGIFAVTFQLVITFLMYVRDVIKQENIVQYVAISLLPIVYALFFMIFLLPMQARLNVRLKELLYSNKPIVSNTQNDEQDIIEMQCTK